MKDVISKEGYEQEALDGAGLVHVDMIGVPFVGQLVEAIILDIPSSGLRRNFGEETVGLIP